jgi:hypothetical protein
MGSLTGVHGMVEQHTEEKEFLLLVKRIGIDKTWQVAPYPRMTRERTERLAEWMKRALTGCPMETKVVEV